MKIIRDNIENYLLEQVEIIRQGNAAWSAVYIRLSNLSMPVPPYTVQAVAHVVGNISGTDDASFFMLHNQDVVVLLPMINSAVTGRIVQEVSFMFAEDRLAQGMATERGNDLCIVYASRDEWIELHRLAIKWQNDAGEKMRQMTHYVPQAELFAKAKHERIYRRRICILVVEDQRFSQQLIVEIIGAKFDILTAENGAEALKFYETYAPDIVFLDIDMPGMDGHAVLQAITALDPEAFVVMLTASQSQGDVQQALKNQACGYVVKPFTKRKIDQYLHLYQQKSTMKNVRPV